MLVDQVHIDFGTVPIEKANVRHEIVVVAPFDGVDALYFGFPICLIRRPARILALGFMVLAFLSFRGRGLGVVRWRSSW